MSKLLDLWTGLTGVVLDYGCPASANTQSAHTGIPIQNNGSGGAHNTQPTLVLNKIIKL